MVEVIVATVVFVLAAAGLFATVSALRLPAEESSKAVTAAFIGKRILESLRNEVDATTWTGGALDPAGSPYTLPPVMVNGISYTPTYAVENDPAGTTARKVTLDIVWP